MVCSKARAEMEALARAYLEAMSDDALSVVTALLKDSARDYPRQIPSTKPVLIDVSSKSQK